MHINYKDKKKIDTNFRIKKQCWQKFSSSIQHTSFLVFFKNICMNLRQNRSESGVCAMPLVAFESRCHFPIGSTIKLLSFKLNRNHILEASNFCSNFIIELQDPIPIPFHQPWVFKTSKLAPTLPLAGTSPLRRPSPPEFSRSTPPSLLSGDSSMVLEPLKTLPNTVRSCTNKVNHSLHYIKNVTSILLKI